MDSVILRPLQHDQLTDLDGLWTAEVHSVCEWQLRFGLWFLRGGSNAEYKN